MVEGDHSNNDYNVQIIIHNSVSPVTYGIILVGPPARVSPRQAEKRNIFSFHFLVRATRLTHVVRIDSRVPPERVGREGVGCY